MHASFDDSGGGGRDNLGSIENFFYRCKSCLKWENEVHNTEKYSSTYYPVYKYYDQIN